MDLDALVGGRVSVPKEQALQLAFTTRVNLNGVWCKYLECVRICWWKVCGIPQWTIKQVSSAWWICGMDHWSDHLSLMGIFQRARLYLPLQVGQLSHVWVSPPGEKLNHPGGVRSLRHSPRWCDLDGLSIVNSIFWWLSSPLSSPCLSMSDPFLRIRPLNLDSHSTFMS